jgi:hypothetical protein
MFAQKCGSASPNLGMATFFDPPKTAKFPPRQGPPLWCKLLETGDTEEAIAGCNYANSCLEVSGKLSTMRYLRACCRTAEICGGLQNAKLRPNLSLILGYRSVSGPRCFKKDDPNHFSDGPSFLKDTGVLRRDVQHR